jgi:hypothetical protein
MQDEPIGGSIVGDDFCIARIWSDTDSHTENAAYLCHAANSYPRLVEGLKRAEAMFGSTDDNDIAGLRALLHSLGESE